MGVVTLLPVEVAAVYLFTMRCTQYLSTFTVLLALRAGACSDYAEEGKPYALECEVQGLVRRWYLHGEGMAYDLESQGDLRVDQQGDLIFPNVSATHQGEHLCIYDDGSGQLQGIKVPMTVRMLPPSNLWEAVYKEKTIRGVIAGVVVAIILSWGCLVNSYAFRGDELTGADPRKNRSGSSSHITPIPLESYGMDKGHFNPALENDAY